MFIIGSQSFEEVECETPHWEGGTIFVHDYENSSKDKINCGLTHNWDPRVGTSIQHPQQGDNRIRKTFLTNVDLETELKKLILMILIAHVFILNF